MKEPPLPSVGQQADGSHPTGMHSCLQYLPPEVDFKDIEFWCYRFLHVRLEKILYAE